MEMGTLWVEMGGQSTSFDKADGQHLSDFDATSHI